MNTTFWDSFQGLTLSAQLFFILALLIAFAFEFINGFHDTANAVTTVIYTKTLKPTPAVIYSGIMNFLGVLLGGTTVAFSIVNLLPVDLLVEGDSLRAIVMVLSLLLTGVIWNLGTWWLGLPVSSSHTLIGSILGVGLANSLLSYGDLTGINLSKVLDVGKALLLSPLIGFIAAAALLLLMKTFLRDPKLYVPPVDGDAPPSWIRGALIATCGGVSFAHGSNDGQKGMGLILLALIGFLPTYYAMDLNHPQLAPKVTAAASQIETILQKENQLSPPLRDDLQSIIASLHSADSLANVPAEDRWKVRQKIFSIKKSLSNLPLSEPAAESLTPHLKVLQHAIEYVPLWVIIGVAFALGIGTTIGYKRIVVTIAEKIGKTHLTYAQGVAAESVAAVTISFADLLHLPVSTTHVLSSGVAGTMWANQSGIQTSTIRKILIAWVLTLPISIACSASLFTIGCLLLGAG
jgi:phosphate/sulfate permease